MAAHPDRPRRLAAEQRRLGGVWTFLGRADDAARDGDWFTAAIAGRSVVVQRFGGELRGFENTCAHRGYPLRPPGGRGHGPLRCAYHHWQYDRDGLAVGIPHCRQLFGCLPRELGARLPPVELARCGALVFGRLPGAAGQPGPGLADHLGLGADILEAFARAPRPPRFTSREVAANWRLCLHISLDDYHAVAVHPSTFGRDGYLARDKLTYARFGPHCAFVNSTEPDVLAAIAARCRGGTHRPTCYTIFHVLPNMLLATFRGQRDAFYCALQAFEPLATDRTRIRSWLYPAPFAADREALRRLTEPVRFPIVCRYADRVFREDDVACERLQANAGQIDAAPRLSVLEERIAWFEESLADLAGGS